MESKSTGFWLGVATTVVGTVIAGVILSVGGWSGDADGRTGPGEDAQASIDQPVETTPTSTTTTETVEPPAEPTASTTDDAPTQAFQAASLTLDQAVTTEWCRQPSLTGQRWRSSAPNIAGTPHGNGFTCRVTNVPMIGWVEFTVPSGATRFTAHAGQAVDAQNTTITLRFEVVDQVTGGVLEAHDVAFGELATFDTQITGMLRLALRVTLLDYAENPHDLSGDASWGDPMFTT